MIIKKFFKFLYSLIFLNYNINKLFKIFTHIFNIIFVFNLKKKKKILQEHKKFLDINYTYIDIINEINKPKVDILDCIMEKVISNKINFS